MMFDQLQIAPLPKCQQCTNAGLLHLSTLQHQNLQLSSSSYQAASSSLPPSSCHAAKNKQRHAVPQLLHLVGLHPALQQS
jgi:hypothetical protein